MNKFLMDPKVKKVLGIVSKVSAWVVIGFAAIMMVFTLISLTTVDKNGHSIFGIKLYIVRTDSMSLSDKNADLDVHFNAGDIIFVKRVKDINELEANDVITFISTNSTSYGETLTHMIREVVKNSKGEIIGYKTFGTNTGVDDESLVEPTYVIGRYAGKIPAVGNFFAFLKSLPGYIICILLPFLLLIVYNGMNVISLFKKYRKEQNEEIQKEREAIEKEKAENQRILEELLKLREELEKDSNQ